MVITKHQKESGFSAVEALILLFALVAIFGIAWFVYTKHNTTPSVSVPTNSPYSGWKSYTSPHEKFTFKYPSDWAINPQNDGVGDNVSEAVYLTGPNNFHLSYTLAKIIPETAAPANRAKSDNGPYSYDPNSNVYNGVKAINLKGLNKQLYIVIDQTIINGNQPVQSIGIAENKAYADQTYINPMYYLAKNATGYEVQWDGDYAQPQGGSVVLTYNDFVTKPEVIKAKLILQSISY